jgi:hypothetical protein
VVRAHDGEPVHLGVAQWAAHVLREHGVAGSRPATETRFASRTRAAEYRAFNPGSQGSSPWRRTRVPPLVAEQGYAPVSEAGAARHVRSTRTGGTRESAVR